MRTALVVAALVLAYCAVMAAAWSLFVSAVRRRNRPPYRRSDLVLAV